MYGQYQPQFTDPQLAQSMQGMQGMMPGMQQQNKIKNPPTGLAQTKGPQINDRDNLNLAIAQEKYLTDNFNTFVREASNRQLHTDVMRIFIETHAITRELFNLMFRKGWYTLEGEHKQKLAQSYQKFQGYSSQFPYGGQMH